MLTAGLLTAGVCQRHWPEPAEVQGEVRGTELPPAGEAPHCCQHLVTLSRSLPSTPSQATGGEGWLSLGRSSFPRNTEPPGKGGAEGGPPGLPNLLSRCLNWLSSPPPFRGQGPQFQCGGGEQVHSRLCLNNQMPFFRSPGINQVWPGADPTPWGQVLS